jgi:hypothetical protein
MLTVSVIATGLACALALVNLGGGFYEFRVVDPFWPRRPDIIQPDRGASPGDGSGSRRMSPLS